MNVEQIRSHLVDRNLKAVALASSVSYPTIRRITTGECKSLQASTVRLLSDYLVKGAENILHDETGEVFAEKPIVEKPKVVKNKSRTLSQIYKGVDPRNTSGYKNVSLHSGSGKWRAVLNIEGKQKHLGYFESKDDAHQAYLDALWIYYPSQPEPQLTIGAE